MPLVTNRIAHTIGTKAKFCPTDRSNSPDIISSVTPIETMPTVAAMLLMAVIVCGDQKFAVCTEKKTATAISPSAGVSSGTRRSVDVREAAAMARSAFAKDCVKQMSGGSNPTPDDVLKGRHVRARIAQQRPASMQACTASILSLVTSEVPVSTFTGLRRIERLLSQIRHRIVALQEWLLVDGDGDGAVLDALRGLGADVEGRDRDIQLVVGNILPRRVGGGTAERGDAADRRVGLQGGANQAQVLALVAGGHEVRCRDSLPRPAHASRRRRAGLARRP